MRFFHIVCCICFLLLLGPTQADTWRKVTLKLDISAGALVGSSAGVDGVKIPIVINAPELKKSEHAEDTGYIDFRYGAFIPIGSGWLPSLQSGDLGWSVEVVTPPDFVTVPFPDGEIIETSYENITRFNVPKLASAPLVIGRFHIAELEADGITIRTFFSSANSKLAKGFLESADEAIGALSARIGPYPYSAFSIVESPLPVGLGFPGFTLVSARILPMPFMKGRSLWHEISHVWWGNGVFVDYSKGNWAEGFAVFFADYALASRKSENAARDMRLDWLLEFDALPPEKRFPLRQFVTKSHGQAQAIGYGKAAMVLQMLERKIGAQVFDNCVQKFWNDWKFQKVGWLEIENTFSECSGSDLSSFFKRWLDDPGAARADLTDQDFLTFRHLAPAERVSTLRLFLSASLLEPQFLGGVIDDRIGIEKALKTVGNVGAGGLPIFVGTRQDIAKLVIDLPPEAGSGIWASRLRNGGGDVIAIASSNSREAIGLIMRSRHYGRYSWVIPQKNGRAKTGRWNG